MTEIFASRTRDEWFTYLKGKDVCVSPVLNLEEAASSEQVRARGNLMTHRHPVAGDTRLQVTPIRMRSGLPPVRMGAPALGEHSAQILAELGYAQEEIDRLLEQGVIVSRSE